MNWTGMSSPPIFAHDAPCTWMAIASVKPKNRHAISTGTGLKPKATDTVKVHYRGTLLDGTEFDSSYAGNEPITFQLNQVIAGWTEGVQLMPVGSKWQFFIPGRLAYGENGAGETNGPNATLIFEVELLGIEGAEAK